MINFEKKIVNLQRCYKQTADMLRKQPCLVRTENLDNSCTQERSQKLFSQSCIIVTIPL